MIRLAHAAVFGIFCVSLFGAWASPADAAVCCKCTTNDKPNENLCINFLEAAPSETDCGALQEKSNNAAIHNLNCTAAISETNCKSVGGGGVCAVGPISDAMFGQQESPEADEEAAARAAATQQGAEQSAVQAIQSPQTQAIITPTLNVPIPGLTLGSVTERGGFLEIPYLAQYISAAYRYLTGIGIIAAAVMIVWGGFKYLLAATGAKVSEGKAVIVDAIIGLVLIFGAYTVLQSINPELTNLKPVRLTRVAPEEFKFMANTDAGFRDGPSSVANAQETTRAADDLTGTATYVAPQVGENVSVAEESQKEKKFNLPSQRIQAYCTPKESRSALRTYDEKIQALVKAVLGFKKICVDEQKCAYVRGGATSLATGKVGAGAGDIPYYLTWMNQRNITPTWSQSCRDRWFGTSRVRTEQELQTLANSPAYIVQTGGDTKKLLELFPALRTARQTPLAQGFYGARTTPEYADYHFADGGGTCYKQLQGQYQSVLTDSMTEQGIFGGDCGTTLSAIYACAGGAIGRPFGGGINVFNYVNFTHGFLNGKLPTDENRPTSREVVVWNADNLAELKTQVAAAGGLRFGDIIVAGRDGHQHNFMFTGGRDDVPFEIFEMGTGSFGVPGAKQGCVNLGDEAGIVCGMATQPKGRIFDYIDHAGTTLCNNRKQCGANFGKRIGTPNWYPVFIFRPYDYQPCSGKAECEIGEACLCTKGDTPKSERWANNDCANANICHKVLTGFCRNDEHCPKGQNCVNNTCRTE